MRFKDISNHENTLVKKINDKMIHNLSSMSYDEIKEKFLSCINSSDVSISKETKYKYKKQLEKMKTLNQLQSWIYNISLKGGGMGTYD